MRAWTLNALGVASSALGFAACVSRVDNTVTWERGLAPDAAAAAAASSAPVEVATSTSLALDPPPRACPARRPDENGPCPSDVGMCEYGSAPDLGCNTIFTCSVGAWSSRAGGACAACPLVDAGASSALDGQPCDAADAGTGESICTTSDAVCACTTGRDDAHVHERRWVCVKPGGSCPLERPRIGSACSVGLEWCDYGGCAFKNGIRVVCDGAVWTIGTGVSCD